MPYGDWDDSFQDLYNVIPGTDQPDVDTDYAEALFETAFTHTSEELEAMGYSMNDVDAIREEFFDYLGIDSADFDWDGWREAMGYD